MVERDQFVKSLLDHRQKASWHDPGVIAFARIVLLLLADLVGLTVLAIRPRRSVEAENLILRRQLALYKERGMKLRRIDAATRVSLACGFKSFTTAATTLAGIELAHRIRKRQFICQSKDGRIPLELRREWYAAIMV